MNSLSNQLKSWQIRLTLCASLFPIFVLLINTYLQTHLQGFFSSTNSVICFNSIFKDFFGAYVSMFSCLHLMRIPLDTYSGRNHHFSHKYVGSHVPGNIYLNLKRDTFSDKSSSTTTTSISRIIYYTT